jgi:hypothetical protein
MTAPVPSDRTPPYIADGTIQLGLFPLNPTGRQADAVMRIVSAHSANRGTR